jgi:uncharacterized protein YigE (DUF2233 family)
MQRLRALAVALPLASLTVPQPAVAQATAPAKPSPCIARTHEGARYTVCTVRIDRATIRLAHARADGSPYATLASLPKTDATTKRPLLFALNAGMFHPDLRPVGLYVEGGKQFMKASTASGPGNFHLKPNGVFFIAGARAGVLETGSYLRARPKADIATQSGPMLVIDGKLHPKFVRAEASRKMRNGVGVTAQGEVVFAISDEPVSFAAFGRLFRDALACPNALFLDGGSVPTLYAPALGRGSNILPMGPMLAVYGG